MECTTSTDFILIGAGAGGSAAASILRKMEVPFMWYEGGENMNHVLTDTPHAEYPSSEIPNWDSAYLPQLKSEDGRDLGYNLPRVVGGMTHHYEGVNFWTLEDTVRSMDISPDEEENVLQYVKNVTLAHVQCDTFDPTYHTHARSPFEPVPFESIMSLNGCYYGKCDGPSCDLNTHVFQKHPNWYKSSSSTEYGTDNLQTGFEAIELIKKQNRITGVRMLDAQNTSHVVCSQKAVLLAAGVMGDARLLLPHVSSYKFFGQPYLFHLETDLVYSDGCDEGSKSGGTFAKIPQTDTESGFLSVVGLCKVNGTTRLAYLAPEMINPNMTGTIKYVDGQIIAQTNYNDNMRDTLVSDVAHAAKQLYGISTLPSFVVDNWAGGGWHWTGQSDLSHRSRVHKVDNLYLADALGVTGTTSGWTSWNARVQGGLAAYRAVKNSENLCDHTRFQYRSLKCCMNMSDSSYFNTDTCIMMKSQYVDDGCC